MSFAIDAEGTLYVVGKIGNGNEIYQLNAVPIPGAVWLFGTGLIGFAGLEKEAKMLTTQ